MQTLVGKRILLGLSGGIAAYKSAELVRRLRELEAEVQVVMTPGAAEFVTPLTFQALSGRAIRQTLLDPAAEAGMGHIELARWPDLIVVAPASANFMARLAHGFAGDLLSTLCLATDKPIAIAPAMNRLMWQNAATQDNHSLLIQRGVHIWGPGSGSQACGEFGDGRMLEPLQLRDEIVSLLSGPRPLQGTRVLLTAGPTREAIDPVRFISNHSSGRMGFAVAQAARDAGAEVTLVSGPVSLTTPTGVNRIDVDSAQEMLDAVLNNTDKSDIFIAVAAVSDYRMVTPANQKIKKTQASLNLALERNPDILATVAKLERRPFCVGFAAETHDVITYAQHKLREKNLDLIAANEVGISGSGFNSEHNALHVLWPGGEKILPHTNKTQLAHDLITLISERYRACRTKNS